MKCVTLSVDIGIHEIPEAIDSSDLTLAIPIDQIRVCRADGSQIEGARVIGYTTTGPVDEFSDADVEEWQTTPLPEELGDDGP
jgi:hypothetical protein